MGAIWIENSGPEFPVVATSPTSVKNLLRSVNGSTCGETIWDREARPASTTMTGSPSQGGASHSCIWDNFMLGGNFSDRPTRGPHLRASLRCMCAAQLLSDVHSGSSSRPSRTDAGADRSIIAKGESSCRAQSGPGRSAHLRPSDPVADDRSEMGR
jgi:hypothetical protein